MSTWHRTVEALKCIDTLAHTSIHKSLGQPEYLELAERREQARAVCLERALLAAEAELDGEPVACGQPQHVTVGRPERRKADLLCAFEREGGRERERVCVCECV
jgi:hypothetical protein